MGAATGVFVAVTGLEGDRDGISRLLGLARRLADSAGDALTLVDLGAPCHSPEDAPGVDALVRVTGAPADAVDARRQAAALAAAVTARNPSVVLLTQTRANLAVAARAAARLDAGLVSGAVALERAPDGALLVTRPACGGRASASVAYLRGPQMATIETDALMPLPMPAPRAVTVEEFAWTAGATVTGVDVIGHRDMDPDTLPVTEARVVVGAGLGAGLPENLPAIQALAAALRGSVAGSRPIIDRGWLPAERLVGQSGHLISPEVYIACGISGSPQHLVGMRDSASIIALNKAQGAPIMRLADLAVVGDCQPVIRALNARLQPRLGAAEA